MYYYKTNTDDPLGQFNVVTYGISNVIAIDEYTLIAASKPIYGLEEIDVETYQSLMPEPEPEPADSEPTQLDRIEAAVSQSNAEIANAAVDAYTLELIESGVL